MNLAKRVMCDFAGAVFLGFLAILALHHNGSIETETLIDSSPQTVWTVLTATDDYPLWNPQISRLRGQLREGNVIEFVEGTGPDAMVFHPRILAVQAVRELRWKGGDDVPAKLSTYAAHQWERASVQQWVMLDRPQL